MQTSCFVNLRPCPHYSVFKKVCVSLSSTTHRLICVHTIVLMRFRLSIFGTLRSNDSDGNENVKKSKGSISNDNNFARASRFFVHFFPEYHVKMPNFAFYGGKKQTTTNFYFSFSTWRYSSGIQSQGGSPTFDKVSG